MSNLGPLTFGKKEEQIFLGREIAQHQDYSEDTAIKIDHEIKRIVNEGYESARKILQEFSDTLVRIATTLLEREVLDAHEINLIIQNQPLDSSALSTPQPAAVPPPSAKPATQPVPVSIPPLAGQQEKPAPA
jgi:cell division protease FtsH